MTRVLNNITSQSYWACCHGQPQLHSDMTMNDRNIELYSMYIHYSIHTIPLAMTWGNTNLVYAANSLAWAEVWSFLDRVTQPRILCVLHEWYTYISVTNGKYWRTQYLSRLTWNCSVVHNHSWIMASISNNLLSDVFKYDTLDRKNITNLSSLWVFWQYFSLIICLGESWICARSYNLNVFQRLLN